MADWTGVDLFFAPPDRGWLMIRATTHAVLFWSRDGEWTDTPAGAHLFESRYVANKAASRQQEASVVHGSILEWLRPPRIRVTVPQLVAR